MTDHELLVVNYVSTMALQQLVEVFSINHDDREVEVYHYLDNFTKSLIIMHDI